MGLKHPEETLHKSQHFESLNAYLGSGGSTTSDDMAGLIIKQQSLVSKTLQKGHGKASPPPLYPSSIPSKLGAAGSEALKPVVLRSEVIHASNTLISIEESQSPKIGTKVTSGGGSQTNLHDFKQSLANTLQGSLLPLKKPKIFDQKAGLANQSISPRNTTDEYPLRKLSSTLSA